MGRRRKSKPIPPPVAPPPPAEDVSTEMLSPVMRRVSQKRIKSTYTTRGQKLGKQGEVLGTKQEPAAKASNYIGKAKTLKAPKDERIDFMKKIMGMSASPYKRKQVLKRMGDMF